MEWRNVFLAIVIVLLAVYLPSILSTVAGTVSEFGDAMKAAWDVGSRGAHHSGDPVTSVAKLAVIGLIVVGVMKLLRK